MTAPRLRIGVATAAPREARRHRSARPVATHSCRNRRSQENSMTPFLWVLVGAWIGAPIGFFAAALCQAAARGDAHLDPTSRRQAADEQRIWDRTNRSND